MRLRSRGLNHFFLSSVAIGWLALSSGEAIAREAVTNYRIPAQPLAKALRDFGVQSGMTIMADGVVVSGKRTSGYSKRSDPETALRTLLEGTGLSFRREGSIFVVTPSGKAVPTPSASPASAADIPNDSEIVVTAQKKEEKISDVPIAMTALSGDALDDRKIEGGSELLRAIPNVNFSKTNFSMYNFSIRGVGTQSISASSDPAVAVSFNSTPLVRNRLFESEFFDMERIEVLRGPQGTLYGRNATAGVVNMIPALPGPTFGGEVKGEVGSFDTTRLSGMLNVPLGDTLGFRVAGAMTKRDGFDYNSFTQQRVNGRDLWSTRATLAWEPSDRFRANVIWQHFEEDDDRLRTGKQLCTKDPGLEKVGNVPVTNATVRGRISQGCLPGSLYDDAAFDTPNGPALVYLYHPRVNSPVGALRQPGQPTRQIYMVSVDDPFAGVTQSRNLREISSNYDPKFRAQNDVVQLNMEFKPSDTLQFVSQTAYSRDRFYSTQDYNRYVTVPLFSDSAQPNLYSNSGVPFDSATYPGPTPGGIFCDPQLGCSDRMVSADLSRSKNRQWSQEFRLQSSFDGPMNFLVGANYLDFKSQDDYYVFNNMFTLIGQWFYSRKAPLEIRNGVGLDPVCAQQGQETRECPYVDPNPIDSLNNQGHNYFLSQNGIRIKSAGLFGEAYWNLSDTLKLTVGGRYTRDKKRADQVPSQLLLAGGTETGFPGNLTGGYVNSGYPAQDDIVQSWGRFTGRIVLDWKPDLSFTDDTLIYASASRGYKGGGTNPPRVDFNPAVVQYQFLPQTFRPEYVNAFEIGIKNSFDGGRFTLNATGFYYDYKDYQVSQIVDRIAYNENFNATSWGLEFEAAWRPSRAFRIDGNLGYLRTRLGKGAQSIDVMNRTQDDPDWVVLRPWLQVPSNCVAPRAIVEKIVARGLVPDVALAALCPGANRVGSWDPSRTGGVAFWRLYGLTYNPLAPYNPDTVGLPIDQGGSGAPNGGRGFYADLEGNELPNAPRLTANIGAQYTFFLEGGDWELTIRGDYYRQSKSYGRIYNTAFDRLRAWDNVNAALTLVRPDSGLTFQLYVKNLFDKAPITGFFVNSDDTGLTTNVFTPDPRIVGFNASVKF